MKLFRLRSVALFVTALALAAGLFPASVAQAAEPQEYVAMLSAQVSESPPAIELSWPAKPTPLDGYQVFRKDRDAQGSNAWSSLLATLPGTATSFTDTGVQVGQTYEYKVQSGSYTGYIYSGIKRPVVEARGKIVLLVEAEQAAALTGELTTLKSDLIRDGWTVLRHDVSRTATPAEARAPVDADYNADPANVKAVFLIGHLPVFKSGNYAVDGHVPEHSIPWAADAYYGTPNDPWAGSPNYIPSEVKLAVGRVDFNDMPAFSKSATELLRQYLNKDHTYRIGQMTTTKDAYVGDGFGRGKIDNAAVNNGYKLFPTLWGPGARIDEGSWKTYLANETYTWGHINGPGGYQSTATDGGSLTTSAIAASPNFGIIFSQSFGSYFGDWDNQNNLLRAFLATPGYGLTNAWTGRPNWFFHHMALGETIGFSTKVTQNNGGWYSPTGITPRGRQIALMGDPALRMYPVLPASDLHATAGTGGTQLTWTASADAGVTDYYVYGAAGPDGPYTRLGVTRSTSWTHANPGSTRYYMVRASALTTTGSGSFYNLSQGTTAETEVAPATTVTVTLNDYAAGPVTRTVTATIPGGQATTTVDLPAQNAYPGWTARGWTTDTAPGATPVAPGPYAVSGDVTLYGLYEQTVTITYDADGGNTTPPSQTGPRYTNSANITRATNASFTLADAITKPGYQFNGWIIDGSDVTFRAGTTVSRGQDTTYKASWVTAPVQYNLVYDYRQNGGVSASQFIVQVTAGSPADLTVTATKPGWQFVGWTTEKYGIVPLTSYVPTGGGVLYAIFTRTITATLQDFDGQNLVTRTAQATIYNNETSAQINPPAQSEYPGWQARGWSRETAATATPVVPGLFMADSDVTLFGLYKKDIVISFDPAGSIISPDPLTGTRYTNSANIAAVANPWLTLPGAITRDGYTFDGWLSNNSGTKYQGGAAVQPAMDTLFTAVWTTAKRQYAVTTQEYYGYNMFRRTWIATLPDNATTGTVYVQIPLPYLGWQSRGWTTSKAPDATPEVVSGAYVTGSDATLYALYQQPVTINYIFPGQLTYTETVMRTTNAYDIHDVHNPTVVLPGRVTLPGGQFAGWMDTRTGQVHPAHAKVAVDADTSFVATAG